MIKISVILPVYNNENDLGQCMESVWNQTLKELEIICVDDGSTDDSLKILKEYSEKDPRIQLFHQKNQGAGAARNTALEHARGKYIAFLDADDSYADTDALERMFHTCEKFRIPICGCRWVYKAYKDGTRKKAGLFKESEKKMLSYRDCQMHDFYQSYIFERKFLAENKIRFPLYRRYQDPPFLVKAAYGAETFAVEDVILYCYRIPERTTRFDTKKTADMLRGILDNLVFARQHGLDILFRNTVKHLYSYTDIIYDNVSPDNLEILKLLIQADEIINSAAGTAYCVIKPLRTVLFSKERYERLLLRKIAREQTFALYGAGKLTRAFLAYFEKEGIAGRISRIVVSDAAVNPKDVRRIPVISYQQFLKAPSDFLLVTVRKGIAEDIVKRLEQSGYSSYEVLDENFAEMLLRL